jgi:hypothetical protein
MSGAGFWDFAKKYPISTVAIVSIVMLNVRVTITNVIKHVTGHTITEKEIKHIDHLEKRIQKLEENLENGGYEENR